MEYKGWIATWSGWMPDQVVVGDLIGHWTATKDGFDPISVTAAALLADKDFDLQNFKKDEYRLQLLAEIDTYNQLQREAVHGRR